MEKVKPVLNGAAETMLQSFYARAMYSRDSKNKFKDEKAEEIVESLDYDFGNAYVCMKCLCPAFVGKENHEEIHTEDTGV